MGRQIRSNIPQTSDTLTPQWPYLTDFRTANKKLKEKQKANFDSRHGVRPLAEIPDDTQVWVTTDNRSSAGLRLVLGRLSDHGILVNPSKCVFGVDHLEFLGHYVDSNGIRPLEDKVQVIRAFPTPTTQRKLREFLGLVNLYHRFIPHAATILQPLNHLLSTPKDKASKLTWTADATTAFTTIKEALAKATLLFHPQPDAPTSIMTDASDVAVGAVLQQRIARDLQPIAYFSKKLKPAETRYSTFDRELLAMYLSVKHFRHFVEGRTFQILTDHKPLMYALATPSARHTPRQIRHLDFISQFTTDIRHVSGADNPAADALSRIGTNALQVDQPPTILFDEIAAAQREDPELLTLRSSPSSLVLSDVPIPASESTIACDTSRGLP